MQVLLQNLLLNTNDKDINYKIFIYLHVQIRNLHDNFDSVTH